MIIISLLNMISTSISHTSWNWLSHSLSLFYFSLKLVIYILRAIGWFMLSRSSISKSLLILRKIQKPLLSLVRKLCLINYSIAFTIIASFVHIFLWIIMVVSRIFLWYFFLRDLLLILVSFWSLIQSL